MHFHTSTPIYLFGKAQEILGRVYLQRNESTIFRSYAYPLQKKTFEDRLHLAMKTEPGCG